MKKSPIKSTEILKQIRDDLKELLKDQKFMTPTGEERELNFYLNEIPAPSGEYEDEDSDPELISAPYCLIKIIDGSFTEWKYTRKINAAVIFCIYDQSSEKAGHNVILDILDQVFEHYAKIQMIGDSLITLPIDWTTQTDLDTFPFYFGAFSLELETEGAKIPLSDLT